VVKTAAVRGQYAPGWVSGESADGYHEEQGVPPDSMTETFVALKVEIDNWRWAGTPFYLRTGKRLPRRATEIAIAFKPAPHLPFAAAQVQSVESNLLVLRIQPDEGASLRFTAKTPGPQIDLRPVTMDFEYGTSFLRGSPDAYERLLLDCLLGDATLFARWDEVERAWEIFDPLIAAWASEAAEFPNYEAGTWGPGEADALVARDGRHWRRL
jgi:glucose-6-phosphate 1-dehydrogenase